MRLHYGSPPPDPDFHPEREGCTKLREPNPILLQIIAAPVAFVNLAVLIPVWGALAWAQSPANQSSTGTGDGDPWHTLTANLSLFAVLAGIPLLIAVHELLHAVCYPGGLASPRTAIGIWPTKLLFYATHLGPMSRNRYLWVYACPILVLTVLPLIIAAALPITLPALAGVSVLNGVFACGDQVAMAMLAWQVPSTAVVRNQGWETWWMLPGQATTCLDDASRDG
jgi:hypothetical protein